MEEAQQWAERVRQLMGLARSGEAGQLEKAYQAYLEMLGPEYTMADAILETRDAEKGCAIHVAAQAGNVAAMTWFESQVGRDVLVRVETKTGTTPLMCAVQNNHAQMVELLIQWGADVYHADAAKLTAIHLALTISEDKGVLALLTENLQPHENLYSPATVTGSLLTWSVLTNNISLFKRLVDISEPALLAADCLSSTLPCAVVASAHVETAGVVLHYLLQKAVAPDTIAKAHDQQGCTVIGNLAQLEDPSLLLRLMSGCTPACLQELCNQRGEKSKTPFLLAATQEARDALAPFTSEEGRVDLPEEPDEPPTAVADREQQVPQAEKLKVEANKLFADRQYEAAEHQFDAACTLLGVESLSEEQPGVDEELRALISTITANLSVTCLRLQKYDKAEHCANLAIKFAPDWYKGYYRLAMVLKARQDYAEAAQQMYQCILRNSREESLQ